MDMSMTSASCHVAFLPLGQAIDYFELPQDGPGIGAGSASGAWSAWDVSTTAPTPAGDASLSVVMAAFSTLLWRWSGRTAFTLHLRLPGSGGSGGSKGSGQWMLAAVRLTAACTWRDLAHAWTAALEGRLSLQQAWQEHWPDGAPPAARIGLDLGADFGPDLEPVFDPASAAPDALHIYWQWSLGAEGAAARVRQRGMAMEPATLALLSDAWLQAVAGTPPACALEQVPLLLLGAEEARWTQPADAASRLRRGGATLASRLAQLAAQSPDLVAVESGSDRLSYGALHAVASALAQRIVALAGNYTEPVGVMFPPGPQMLIAVYGALLANKYYVPLDPHYPAERLAAMVADADPVLIIADGPLQARAGDIADGIPVLRLDAPGARTPAALPAVDPAGLAYVLYTSGSSGVPKGVMQSHENVLFHADTYGNSIGLGAADRIALLASLCFDASVMDIFGALAYGASLHPFTPADTEPAALLAALDDAGITVFHATPTLFRLLFGGPDAAAPRRIRAVVLGGELVTPSDVALFRRVFGPAVTLINGYGPTESTMALQYPIAPQAAPASGGVPVGYPVPGMRASIGAPGAAWRAFQEGELFLHSDHLFLGYLNREDETASRLVEGSDGRRYYRSGDLALRLPDGRITMRGRVDQQMKFHGFRIEPGDIEAGLLAFPGIAQAAVRLGQLDGQDALLAYVGAGDGATGLDEAALRSHLRAQLPPYMQPTRIVQLASLPLTPSGKIDRMALPAMVQDDEHDDHERRQGHAGAAVDSTGERLAGLWRQVLGRRPSPDASFFGAGGHSLAALQLVGRIRQAFGIDYSLPQILNAASFAQMAADIDRLRQAAPASIAADLPVDMLTDTPAGHSAPLAPVQRGIWYLHHTGDAAARAYNMQLAFRLHGAVDAQAFGLALEHLTARHATLRTGFPLIDESPVQQVDAAPGVRLRRCDAPEGGAGDAYVRDIAQAEAAQPFDLATPPLMRVVFGSLAPGEYYVVATLHHLIADGWSLVLLLKEFGLLYGAALSVEPAPRTSLTPLPVQYTGYAAWQHARLDQAARAHSARFWRTYLAGAAPTLRWKAVDPTVEAHAGGSHAFTIPADLRQALEQLGARHRATPFMTLLAVWSLQLAAESGRSDIVVGTAAANRTTPEAEQMIGLFVNSLPLRVEVTPSLPFQDYLCRVRDSCLAAFAHQELPFDELVRLLGRAGERGANPVFQTMLTLDAFGFDALAPLPGLGVSVIEREQQSSHLDLALSLRPNGDAWAATLTFARALFSKAEAERLGNNVLALMRAVAAQPAAPCAELNGGDGAQGMRLLAAAHWHAEHEAIRDCVRLMPAPQGGAGAHAATTTAAAAVPSIGAARRSQLLAAVLFTLWRWTGGDSVALRLVTRAGVLPLRLAPGSYPSFEALRQAVVRSYRDAARFQPDGGATMHAASLACQVEVDLVRGQRPPQDGADPAWLAFAAAPESGAAHWRMRHRPDAFDATQAAWFAAAVAACLAHAAEASIARPALAAGSAAAAAAAAKSVFPQGPAAPLPPLSIAQLIAQQAARTPDALALVAGGYRLSYRELDGQASALARRLLDNGARPGAPLAILLERGAAVPICFLAGLKAGLCLAPLDPEWPAERLADVLRQLAPPLTVVDRVHDYLPSRQLVYSGVSGDVPGDMPDDMSSDVSTDAAPQQADFSDHAAPDHPAYIVHTSGTTGIPKAALNFQRGLLNRLLFMNRYFGGAAAQSVLQTTPHWFDSALWQFFWPWMNGGCCVVEHTGPDAWAASPHEQLLAEAVSVVDFTPSRLRGFLDTITPAQGLALQHVIVGGELLSAGIIGAFREKLPQARLHNFYGPSETAIGVICADVTDSAPGQPVPIGWPIDNVLVRVVDADGGVLPAGAVGELLIGGVCVGVAMSATPLPPRRRLFQIQFLGLPISCIAAATWCAIWPTAACNAWAAGTAR